MLFATKLLTTLRVYCCAKQTSSFRGGLHFAFTRFPLAAPARLRFHIFHERSSALLTLAPFSASESSGRGKIYTKIPKTKIIRVGRNGGLNIQGGGHHVAQGKRRRRRKNEDGEGKRRKEKENPIPKFYTRGSQHTGS